MTTVRQGKINADVHHVSQTEPGIFLCKRFNMMDTALLEKYNVPVPRYTSYPTVPNWKENIDVAQWQDTFRKDFADSNSKKGISLYIHLPFCESLCTYCGCNKKITTNHGVESQYLHAVISEWQQYMRLMSEKPVIRELHLGGGTPTFFSPANLDKLVSTILKDTVLHPEHEFSFEGHPNNTSREHLEYLYGLGFRRLSLGIQDNDPEVQRVINRIQPVEQVQYVTETARKLGYKSVNFDLIYGLPLQTVEGMTATIKQTIALKPDRIAFYSYAHVPWTSKGQRLFDERDLPSAKDKLKLYHTGKALLLRNGYYDIGMDHFALAKDDLYKAWTEGTLHRNFMGYTTHNIDVLLGLGVSSISCTPHAFAQNCKTLHNYYGQIDDEQMAIDKGCFLSNEDIRFGRYILDISCKGQTRFETEDLTRINNTCIPELVSLQKDGLIELNENEVRVSEKGKNFVRNICSAFDLYLQDNRAGKGQKMFSNAI